MDINTKKLKKNGFRITTQRGITASRIRIPGGQLDAHFLPIIKEIADKYGNGTIHLTTRQGIEIPGIDFANISKVNTLLQPLIEACDIPQKEKYAGYPAAGTRNISACIGTPVCPYACFDTATLAKKIDKLIYPNDIHLKVAITGCPMDCAKVRMHDFGIIGMTLPHLEEDRCISCGACGRTCNIKSVGALKAVNFRPRRNEKKCIGCGECVLVCPNAAWTRSQKKYFMLTALGRSGKKNPRLAQTFIKWADEESILKIISNTYSFIQKYMNGNAPGGKEHLGYIVDRVGFPEFKKWVLRDVTLPPIAEVSDCNLQTGLKY